MRINSIFSIFTPKDVKFFPLLKETASILVESSTLLEQLFSTPTKKRKELCLQIKTEEMKGDKVTGRISKALNETFITPFDREDIHDLSERMDDAIDAINRTAQMVLLYSPENLPKYTLRLATIVKKGTEALQLAINELSGMKQNDQQVRKYCKEIKKMEEAADDLYGESIMSLFKEERSTVELIKLKEIIQELEMSANKINDTSKVLKTILVKYA